MMSFTFSMTGSLSMITLSILILSTFKCFNIEETTKSEEVDLLILSSFSMLEFIQMMDWVRFEMADSNVKLIRDMSSA